MDPVKEAAMEPATNSVAEFRRQVYNQKTTCPNCGSQMQLKHFSYKHRCPDDARRKKEPQDFEQRALKAQQRAEELFKKRMNIS